MIVDQLYILKTTSSLDSYDFIIASYLLAHWQEACSEKMATIISKLGVSKSTLARFCKKLGYRCFTVEPHFISGKNKEKLQNKKANGWRVMPYSTA